MQLINSEITKFVLIFPFRVGMFSVLINILQDPAGFAAARRKADIELKSITQSINDLQIELKSNVEIVEKVKILTSLVKQI